MSPGESLRFLLHTLSAVHDDPYLGAHAFIDEFCEALVSEHVRRRAATVPSGRRFSSAMTTVFGSLYGYLVTNVGAAFDARAEVGLSLS